MADERYIDDERDPDAGFVPETDEEGEESGLYEHFAITADKGQSLLRLDKFLVAHMENCSRNRIQAPQLLCLISRII